MALSKTMQLGETRSLEIRATMNNAFNTVQYSGVDTNVASPTFGQVTSAGSDAVVSIYVEVQVLMAHWIDKAAASAAICALALPGVQIAPAQEANGAQQDNYVLKANAELVLTNVVVRDTKTGEFVRGLKQSDFTVLENGKPQQISTFDFQSVDMATPAERSDGQRAGGGSRTDREQRPSSSLSRKICAIIG